ncbi:penicillin-binding protein 1B [Suttonella sp. R2A3]|uniref:penicillin-binding protein 1B n=1 Tax=Suttonella sp. R2A3 TaxID=2908648 RepID=UPI001F424D7A|nr:penicillin-binding protein 1B [Suttonella sp. R2A3]UJF24997.1 penicillin-binding protein 1B [Suttonella sp. R2A3]
MLKLIRNTFYFLVALFILGLVVAVGYGIHLDQKYGLSDEDLGGALWSMPAKVYARPMELYQGAEISAERLVRELEILGYHKTDNPVVQNTYSVGENTVTYYAIPFVFWDGAKPPRKIEVSFANGKVTKITNLTTLEPEVLEKLNPLRIANIYPKHREDRILVDLDDAPPVLIDGLIALEDRYFWQHPGIDPKGIMRSIYVTFIKQTGFQGASTLTQQFVKNHYLTNEPTLSRKIKEMLMAIALETHASKQDILEGYLNEIYLGQDGQRAIHGFGLASEFFFDKKLKELNLHEVAMLLALVREPGDANPHRHSEYALERRNLVLDVMFERELISDKDLELAKSLPLDVVDAKQTTDRVLYPAFVNMVSKQLAQYYSQEDLTREGLNIFTTLDPLMQEDTQEAISSGLPVLEQREGLKSEFLQSAAVVVNSTNGEINALVGSRTPGDLGFNRALSAKRQAGSLVKPMVYLSALEWPQLYSLASMIDDSPLNYDMGNGTVWSPKNYSKRNHGQVMLIDGLVKSYNIPTARIALNLGISDVVSTMKRLGGRDDIPTYPSVSLGTVHFTPMEIAQMYETLANGGYYTPLRAIREITSQDGEVIQRFPLSNTKAIEPGPHYLITKAMQEIPRRGTARSMSSKIDPSLNIAGKTGTTDNYRDSWFAGYSGNVLSVVWVGNDQNKPTKLSGSSGALRVWMDVMKNMPLKPLNVAKPGGIVEYDIDPQTGLRAGRGCTGDRLITLPFIAGSQPQDYTSCVRLNPEITEPESGGASPYYQMQTNPMFQTPGNTNTNPSGNTSGWFGN